MMIKKIILMMLMIVAAISAAYLSPTHKIAAEKKDFVLDNLIPKKFGDWHMLDDDFRPIVNPQQEATINRIYSQTLSRTYENSNGDRIMFVIAYGEDQSDSNQLHYPEVCYPAQGFQIISKSLGLIDTAFGEVRVTKLIAKLSNRIEPITYWTTVGNRIVRGKRELKLEQLKYGLKGYIPDGLLFRVSTIIGNEAESVMAYKSQEDFIRDLVGSFADKRSIVFGE